MARRPQLEEFARQHNLKIGTIADLIHYRLGNERTVERRSQCRLDSAWGPFTLTAYEDVHSGCIHLALVRGEIRGGDAALVRVHLQDSLCDVLEVARSDCGLPLKAAMVRVADEGAGVVVILRNPEDPSELLRRINDYHLADEGVVLPRPSQGLDLRTYGVGAQILRDLGVRKMRVLGTPWRFHGLAGFGLEIAEYIDYA